MIQKTKRCPYCGNEIMSSAKKCRYCGEWLDNDENDNLPGENPKPSSYKRHKLLYIVIGIVLFLIFCVFCCEDTSSTEGDTSSNEQTSDTVDSDSKDNGSGANLSDISDVIVCADLDTIDDDISYYVHGILIPHAQFDPEEDYSDLALWYVSAKEAADDYISSRTDNSSLSVPIWNRYKESYKAVMLGMKSSPPDTEGMDDKTKEIMMKVYYKYKDAKYEDVEQQYKYHKYIIIFKNTDGTYYNGDDYPLNQRYVKISEDKGMIKID